MQTDIPQDRLLAFNRITKMMPAADNINAQERELAVYVVLALLRSFGGNVFSYSATYPLLSLAMTPNVDLRTGLTRDARETLPTKMSQRDWIRGRFAAVALGWLTPISATPPNTPPGIPGTLRPDEFVLTVSEAGLAACERTADAYRDATQKIAQNGHAWLTSMCEITTQLLAFGELFTERYERTEEGGDARESEIWLSTHPEGLGMPCCMPGDPTIASALLEQRAHQMAAVHRRIPDILSDQASLARNIASMARKIRPTAQRSEQGTVRQTPGGRSI